MQAFMRRFKGNVATWICQPHQETHRTNCETDAPDVCVCVEVGAACVCIHVLL